MTDYFHIGDFLFFPGKNEIHRHQEITKVRPKTADLLTVLLEANGAIVSKGELLGTVWSDVAAEEYVVFQSVTELRKIFADTKVIKTHPRKGYSVAVAIKKCTAEPETAEPEKSQNIASDSQNTTKPSNRTRIVLTVMSALVIITLVIINPTFQQQEEITDSGSIVVLPVNNRIVGAEHVWVRYGGMDLLIKYLQSQVNTQVLPTEMVLDTLIRAGVSLPETYTGSSDTSHHEAFRGESFNNEISRLFDVSGARLIVTQSISGFSGEYELVYRIYEQHDVTQGVLFGGEIDTLLVELNSILLQLMGVTEPVQSVPFQHHFTNALMASAIDEAQQGNHQQAATMYKAVLVAEPKNILAIRLLVKSLVHLGNYVEAEAVAADAVKHVMQNGDNKNLGRLFFWQAVSITQQHRYDDALAVLHYAKAKSEHTNDLLYLANVARIAGKLYLQKQQFIMARGEIDMALSLYTRINEPYGQASMYIDLGELELAQNHPLKASKAFEKALELATRSRLTQLIDMSNEWLERVNQQL